MKINNNIIVERSGLFVNLEFEDKFSIPDNYVIYFEKEHNKKLSLYIRQNYEMLKSKFAANDLNFIYSPLIVGTSAKVQELISYYLPQLNYYILPEKVAEHFNEKMLSQIFNNFHDEINFTKNKNEYVSTKKTLEELLNIFNFKSSINSGLLYFKYDNGIIGVSDFFYSQSGYNYELFFDEAIQYLSINQWDDYALSSGIIDSFLPTVDYSEQLDEDANKIVQDLENKLNELKDNGQLLFLIPVLKDLLNKQSQNIDFNSISKIEIDCYNKIRLPYYNKEIELSHLTKSIYFLFLKHPEGINLKDLSKYKKELLTMYTSVSNQIDYDKMAKSIDDVINLETKAIYTHLSRIKSAIYKIMDASFAKYYIVSGSGEENRKVLFETKDIIWNNYERFTPDLL